MKKRMLLILVVAMMLFGCGSVEEETTESPVQSETVEEETKTPEIVIESEDTEDEDVQETEKDIPDVQKMLEDAEAEAAVLEKKLQEDASLTQADMNELSYDIYMVWDDVLNEMWGILKDTQDEETMNDILIEQREWIGYKEAEAKNAGAEFAGGSMEALAVNQKAAELTHIRVYELAEYLGYHK